VSIERRGCLYPIATARHAIGDDHRVDRVTAPVLIRTGVVDVEHRAHGADIHADVPPDIKFDRGERGVEPSGVQNAELWSGAEALIEFRLV
jgi:hypothetical protein